MLILAINDGGNEAAIEEPTKGQLRKILATGPSRARGSAMSLKDGHEVLGTWTANHARDGARWEPWGSRTRALHRALLDL